MILTIKGMFNMDHPSFHTEFDGLQQDSRIFISEFYQRDFYDRNLSALPYLHIKFQRNFMPNPLAARLGATWDAAEVEVFVASIEALQSFQVGSIQKELILLRQPVGGFPSQFRIPLGPGSLSGFGGDADESNTETEDTPGEGQRIHAAQFENGDYGVVEITRESVPVEEVIADIDKALAENKGD